MYLEILNFITKNFMIKCQFIGVLYDLVIMNKINTLVQYKHEIRIQSTSQEQVCHWVKCLYCNNILKLLFITILEQSKYVPQICVCLSFAINVYMYTFLNCEYC